MPMASAANSSARTLLHHERKSRHTRRQGKAGQSLELVSQIAKSEPSLHAGSQLTIELDAEVCDEPARLLRSRTTGCLDASVGRLSTSPSAPRSGEAAAGR